MPARLDPLTKVYNKKIGVGTIKLWLKVLLRDGIVTHMFSCDLCQKGIRTIAFSRHKKGSSGAGGTWALRAPISKKIQRPNLHSFQSMKLCSKCLKEVKKTAGL